MLRNILVAGVLCVAPLSVAQAQSNDFDQPSDTAGMTTDRYAPATLQAGATGGGRTGVLAIGTDVSDGQNNRPSNFSSAFYNTQGVQFGLNAGTKKQSVEFYIPDANWATSDDDRLMGLWGFTGNAYPIIEFARVGGVDQFRAWSNGPFVSMGLPTGFTYETWYEVGITLDVANDQFIYSVGDLSMALGANGSTSINTAFLQVHNTADGVTRTQYMDNFVASVPEPATWAFLILGFGAIGGAMRRRANVAVRYA